MNYAIGAVLAIATGVFGRVAKFDRESAFYSTVLIVVASYYLLFAAIGADTHALLVETIFFLAFSAIAVIGFKGDLRCVAAGLIAHGLFDFFLHGHIPNTGMPVWGPGFCGAYDVVIGVWMLVGVKRR
jgi:hypothetical protein